MDWRIVPTLAGIAVAISAVAAVLPYDTPGLSYDSNDALRMSLERHGILMSSPIRLGGEAAVERCSFFADEPPPEFCTSTELEDATGRFLGNIHMSGAAAAPGIALGVVQYDGTNRDHIVAVADTMVRHLVCDCWADLKPGGFDSVSVWIDDVARRHDTGDSTTKSRIDGLPYPVLIEVSDDGSRWNIMVGAVP